MNKTKYVLSLVFFCLMFVLSIPFGLLGVYYYTDFQEQALHIPFWILSAFFLLIGFGFMALNWKKIRTYEKNRDVQKLYDEQLTVLNVSIEKEALIEKLLNNNYKKINKYQFYKIIEDNHGEVSFDWEYNVLVIDQNNGDTIYLKSYLDFIKKSSNTINLAFIFINENKEESLSILEKYIREAVKDTILHPFKYKKYIYPFIICKDNICFLKYSQRSHYKTGLSILDLKLK